MAAPQNSERPKAIAARNIDLLLFLLPERPEGVRIPVLEHEKTHSDPAVARHGGRTRPGAAPRVPARARAAGRGSRQAFRRRRLDRRARHAVQRAARGDRKSTRLNSSHANISYAVFCLKKKKKKTT